MVRKSTRAKKAEAPPPTLPLWRVALRWLGRGLFGLAAFHATLICIFSFAPPPGNLYQWSESLRLGGIRREWVDWEDIAPVMARSVVAAEDANFCLHWGFDMVAIRDAIESGANRGASTLSQQVVKNVFLWQGRSWMRKAMEALLTPAIELMWSKRRILELYLNEAEFAEGVFGVQAAARALFKVDAKDLTPTQAARLAAVLPDPKDYNAAKPGPYIRRRASQIASGAETIEADGRADCFEAVH
jgi:monofunctional biosynthetic peptidoglycan transglycosylase